MVQAVIRLSFSSVERSKNVFHALNPETKIILTPRSKVRIKRRGKNIILHFETKDTSALRASINSYLRFASLAKTVIDVVDNYN